MGDMRHGQSGRPADRHGAKHCGRGWLRADGGRLTDIRWVGRGQSGEPGFVDDLHACPRKVVCGRLLPFAVN